MTMQFLAFEPRKSWVGLLSLALTIGCADKEDGGSDSDGSGTTDADSDGNGTDGDPSGGGSGSGGSGSSGGATDGGSGGSGSGGATDGSASAGSDSGSGSSGSTGSGGSDGTAGDTAGGGACPPNDAFNCSAPVDCDAMDCGDPWSWFDADGCMRMPCQMGMDSCPDGERCYAPAMDGGCVGSTIFCEDSDMGCACGGTDDCGGSFCLPMDLPATCGGFAGGACPDGTECLDVPTDDCDPMNGGSDCPGICR